MVLIRKYEANNRTCQLCGTTYTPTRSRDRYCLVCCKDAVEITKHFNALHRRIRESWKAKYKGYRGKGIDAVWATGEHIAFIRWSLQNGWKKGLVLDRRDGTKGYGPNNCRYVTRQENARNQVKHITDIDAGTRCCHKCHVIKPFEDFYAHPNKAYGIDYACKACATKERKHRYREAHPEVKRIWKRYKHP